VDLIGTVPKKTLGKAAGVEAEKYKLNVLVNASYY